MNAPLVKHELIISRCPNPRAISACIATKRAWKWVKSLECYFGSLSFLLSDEHPKLPLDTTLCVYECYDFEEVFKYLSSKPFVHEKKRKDHNGIDESVLSH